MTVKRAIKLKTYSTVSKQHKVDALIRRYRKQVNLFIDKIWNDPTAKLDSKTLASVDRVQSLSERFKSNALKQALTLCKNKSTKSKPKFDGFPILDAKFVEISQAKTSSEFDLWIKLSTLQKGNRIQIPSKKHKQLNHWLKNGRIIQGCELRPSSLIVWIESELNENKGSLKVGIDIGMNKLVSTSYGSVHGTEFKTINDKILRKKKNSKAYKRAIVEKKNYINRTVNELPWNQIQTLFYENLKNLKKGKKNRSKITRQKQQHWSYRQVIESVKMKAQVNRVRLCYVNPAYTSQMCSTCGNVAASARVLENYCCKSCGSTQDADTNAAKNILSKGLQWIESLESSRPKSVIN